MNIFLDAVQDVAAGDAEAGAQGVSDDEVDRLIDAEATAQQAKEIADLADLRAELAKLKGADRSG